MVGAADPVVLDDSVGARRAEPERVVLVPLGTLGEPVDHRPLVQPEAAELSGTGRGGAEQVPHDAHRTGAVGEVGGEVEVQDVVDHVVPAAGGPFGQLHGRSADDLEPDPDARRPAPQRAGTQPVVREQEVLDRVRLAALPAGEVPGDALVDRRLVAAGGREPRLGREHVHPAQGRGQGLNGRSSLLATCRRLMIRSGLSPASAYLAAPDSYTR